MDIKELENDSKNEMQKSYTLEDLVALGEKLESLEAKIKSKEEELDTLTENLTEIKTILLPEIMNALKVKDFTLQSGAKIAMVKQIGASISDANRTEAHAWLRENNHGDLIKNQIKIDFGKGEDEDAKKLIEYLTEQRKTGELHFGGLEQKEVVHPQTLKAFARARVESGEEFPGKTFNLHIVDVVQIKK